MDIKRPKYLQQLTDRMGNGLIKVITGIRRAGKSYLLFNIFKNYLLDSGVCQENIVEVQLDDDSFIALRNPLKLGEYIRSKIPSSNTITYIFIDEIQFVKRIENPDVSGDYITFYEVLNGLLRKNNLDIYITGSNSKMLSNDILTEFRGRGDQVHVYPLTFKEVYDAVGGNFSDIYDAYSLYGGLPTVWGLNTEEQKITYLKSLFKELYIKDIVQRHNLNGETSISMLMEVLASNIGSYTNVTKIENTFKSEMNTVYTQKTIAKHIEYLEDSFLISEGKRYDIKGRKYIGANSKYYFTDVGLRNALLNFRQNEVSHIMENIIFNELIARGYNVDVGIVEVQINNSEGKRQKIKLEVDFIAVKGSEKIYVQSAFSLASKDKEIQEKRSFLKIDDSFRKIIVQKDTSNSWYDDNGFYIMSLKEFLLNP
ncbi:MAG: ATP-binding protein [Sphaerochaetaceae bacterium]|nr:ATP-binding protein [Sphaerochaetaceae bacterium]